MFALILAGGKGSRMGNIDIPKQFLEIGNKPILIHTIHKFLLVKEFEKIVLVMKNEWINHTKDLLQTFEVDMEKIEIIPGGSERHETLIKGVEFIKEISNNDNPIIVSHDAVRPFVDLRIIYDNINHVKTGVAVNTVIPTVDTIVECDKSDVINIPKRENMYRGQTPQTFKLKDFEKSYINMTGNQKNQLTDACKVLLINNIRVIKIKGSDSNIKITTKNDLNYAKFLLKELND